MLTLWLIVAILTPSCHQAWREKADELERKTTAEAIAEDKGTNPDHDSLVVGGKIMTWFNLENQPPLLSLNFDSRVNQSALQVSRNDTSVAVAVFTWDGRRPQFTVEDPENCYRVEVGTAAWAGSKHEE